MKTISKRVLPIITFGAGLWLLGGCMSPTDETDPLMDEAQATDTEAQATDTEEQTETVNQALRKWKAMGATLGGRVWLDAGLNTKESWASGHLFVSYDAEGPAPIEHITFQFSRNTGYYEQLGQDAIRAIARLSGRAI